MYAHAPESNEEESNVVTCTRITNMTTKVEPK